MKSKVSDSEPTGLLAGSIWFSTRDAPGAAPTVPVVTSAAPSAGAVGTPMV